MLVWLGRAWQSCWLLCQRACWRCWGACAAELNSRLTSDSSENRAGPGAEHPMHPWAALWCPPCPAQPRRLRCGYRSGVAWLMAELTSGHLQFPGGNLLQAPQKPPCRSVELSFGGAQALWRGC